MAVFIDHVGHRRFHRGRILRVARMIADSPDELRDFAERIGLRAEWLRGDGGPGEHCILVAPMRARAVSVGAIPIGPVAMDRKLAERDGTAAARRHTGDLE